MFKCQNALKPKQAVFSLESRLAGIHKLKYSAMKFIVNKIPEKACVLLHKYQALGFTCKDAGSYVIRG